MAYEFHLAIETRSNFWYANIEISAFVEPSISNLERFQMIIEALLTETTDLAKRCFGF